jgi:hypothetical protein
VAEQFDIEQRWPELFEQLEARQRRAIVQSFVSAWHEGWVPNREDVKNLTDEARGDIDHDEYFRRVAQAAERHRRGGAPQNLSMPIENFSGATPEEICRRYAAGFLTREQLVDELARFPYVKGGTTDGYDTLIVDPPGAWSEVDDAARLGLIDDAIYEEVFSLRHGLG